MSERDSEYGDGRGWRRGSMHAGMNAADSAERIAIQQQIRAGIRPQLWQNCLRAQSESDDYISGAKLSLYSTDIRATGIDIGDVMDFGGRVVRIHGEVNLAAVPRGDNSGPTGKATTGAVHARGRRGDWRPVALTITPCADGSMEVSDARCDCPVGLLNRSGIWLDSQGRPHDVSEGGRDDYAAAGAELGGISGTGSTGDTGSVGDDGGWRRESEDDYDDFADFGDCDDIIGYDDADASYGASFGSRGGRMSRSPGQTAESSPRPSRERFVGRQSAGKHPERSANATQNSREMLCAHEIALCELFIIMPQLFSTASLRWGLHMDEPEGAMRMSLPELSAQPAAAKPRSTRASARRTSSALQEVMERANSRKTGVRRQNRRSALESLRELEDNAAGSSKGRGRRKATIASSAVVPTIGSVHLQPHLEYGSGGWELSLRINCGQLSYVVQDLSRLIGDFRDCKYDAYGKKLAFVHAPQLLDAYSRQIYEYLLRLQDTRLTVSTMSFRYYASSDYAPELGKKLRISEPEVCELLDLHGSHVQSEAPGDEWYAPAFLTNRRSPLAIARLHAAANLEAMQAQTAGEERRRGVAHREGEAIADAAVPDSAVPDSVAPDSVALDSVTPGSAIAGPAIPSSLMLQCHSGTPYSDPSTMHNAPIFEGDPAVFVTVEAELPGNPTVIQQTGEPYSAEDFSTARGVTFMSATHIKAFVHGVNHSYAVVESPQTNGTVAFFRLSQGFIGAESALNALCGDSGEQYVSASDWAMFEDSVMPALESAGVKLTLPTIEGSESSHMIDPDLAFYLDRDDNGVTCELVAGYPGASVQLIPGQGVVHARMSQQRAMTKLFRNTTEEGIGIDMVRQLFPAVNDQGLALIEDNDADAIMFLMHHGLNALRQAGTVYATDAFNAIKPRAIKRLRFGVSMKSHLLEVSPIADEISASEVAALLASYRRRRRYHRLSNGEFIDLEDSHTGDELMKFGDAAEALGLTDDDIANGGAQLPASRAFVAQALDDDEVVEDESFRDYVHDMDVIDPERYSAPKSLNATMRPYQLEGFRWLSTLYDKGFGGILADEMGLGKTVQTIALLLARRQDGTALVVCPASLVYNWSSECAKFAPDLRVEVAAGNKAQRRAIVRKVARVSEGGARPGADGNAENAVTGDNVTQSVQAAESVQFAQAVESVESAQPAQSVQSAQSDDAPQRPELIITSYDLLRRDIDDYKDAMFSTVVLDEAQYIKNPQAQMTHAAKSLNAQHRFALTGTPIENKLSELWSIFDFLMPGLLRNYHWFRSYFEGPIVRAIEDGRTDVPAALRLRAITQVFIKRRLKSQVLHDLPERLETTVKVQLEGAQRKFYAAQEHHLRAMLDGDPDESLSSMTLPVLAELTRLREICCDPRLVYNNAPASSAKLDAIVDIVSTAIDSGRRVLVFSQFTMFLDIISRSLDKAGIDNVQFVGSTPKKRRIELADDFNAGVGAPVMLISLKAGNTGLNLVGASVVVHADPWWNAAAQDQATGRAHRIGQTHDVDVYQIIAADTVEERVHDLQESKSRLAHAFTTVDRSAGAMSDADAKIADAGLFDGFDGDGEASAPPSIGRMTRGDILRLLS